MDRNEAIKRIRDGLKRRSGKTWSVTGGRGTAWGWIRIDAPPARCTWTFFDTGLTDRNGTVYGEFDTAKAGHHMSPEDRVLLARLLGKDDIHFQGESVPASSAYYEEYVARAEGQPVKTFGTQYWD